MSRKDERTRSLPPPWDRIFSLGTRLFVWGLIALILYILRPFFLTIFLTFVFAYIQAHGVEGLEHRFKSRAVRVVLVFLVFLGAMLATGFFLAPQVKEQAEQFYEEYPVYLKEADAALYDIASKNNWVRELIGVNGDAVGTDAANANSAETDPNGTTEEPTTGEAPVVSEPQDTSAELQGPPAPPRPIIAPALNELLGFTESQGEQDLASRLARWESVFGRILGITSAFFLSLLFSFLIVLDLPKIRRGVSDLANTRIGFIYDEVADNVFNFGTVLGRALEAQLVIAICNTILTALGLWVLGFPNLVFLSAIVFFCSFIPVAGVFISSVPICLVALKEDGFSVMLIAITMIFVIHLVEAYLLNPRIFGHHLRMNPVLVLIVLTIGGKLFGIWGLILGLPIVTYVLFNAIRWKDEDGVPVAAGAGPPHDFGTTPPGMDDD